ncbi:AMP-binding protein [Noviherbaspirillum sp. CPCC 100848]|uniref:AMP-binding protein n=1 Tax=Noviherbaspirillum album TaxID=3080276 RepID=A0ABU6JBQ4_9BURK|nr:AMP-binding protein [Noviherbaspirillum sp. CPCC 100848]MEC4720876.1 AMP-binding protein [Noviherbaspirillum sp. CPCC 100848]
MDKIPYFQEEKPLHEYLRQHARAQPGKPAYVWYGASLTYRQVDDMSDRFAARLAGLGVKKGDRVVLFLNNCPQYVIAHFGIQKLGAIVSPCSPLFKKHELAYQVADVGAEVIVAADTLYPVVQEVMDKTPLKHVFLTSYGDLLPQEATIDVPPELRSPKNRVADTMDLLEALEGMSAPPQPELSMDDVVLMTYTSGTTGMPKGAMLTYRNALFKTASATFAAGVDDTTVTLAIAPLYHIAGMLMGLNVTIYSGATAILMHRFDPRSVLQAIDRYKVSHWYSIAPMNVAAMQVPDAKSFDLHSLKVNPCTSFGITLTQPLAEQWRDFTGGCQTFEAAYGLSETHTCDTYTPRDAVKWGTQGRPMPGVECRIVDQDSRAVLPVGQMGEITLRSPGNFKGYWNKPEATAATLRDGWVHTGDMGKLDEDGYLTFSGRFKEMIKVSGYSVFPEEVETILIKHPAVRQAAVIGIPDPAKGEVIKAFIVLKPEAADTSVEDIIQWSREQMSPYKVPKSVEFRAEIPATGTGKVLRRLLKD